MAKNDSGMGTKIGINNAPKLRHYWRTEKGVCDCGSKKRIWFHSFWICENKLFEELNKLGYSIELNYKRR